MATGGANAEQSQASVLDRAQRGAPTSWTPSRDLSVPEWAAIGQRFGAVGRCIQWLIGDWITYGNMKFGERYALAAKITGYDTQTLMNMVYVASRFPISRRRENLSWSHHETVASLEAQVQDQWLDEASKHRWGVADLRMMLRAARRRETEADEAEGLGKEVPSGSTPVPSMLPTKQSAREEVEALGVEPEGVQLTRPTVTCPHCGELVLLGSS